MKRRSLLILGAVVIAAVLGLALMQQMRNSAQSDAEFIAEVREIRERGGGSQDTEGILASPDEDNLAPDLQIPTTEFDMGVVSHSEITSKELPFRNAGNRPLTISNIRTTCDCTIGHFDSATMDARRQVIATIPPGEQEPMIISVNPFLIPGLTSTQTLTMTTNDPYQSRVAIEVTMRVDPEFEIEPSVFDFGVIPMGTTPSKSITVRQTGDNLYEIFDAERWVTAQSNQHNAEVTNPQFEASVTEVPEGDRANPDRREWVVTVTLAPGIPPGPFEGKAGLSTDAPRFKDPKLRITVLGAVQAN